MGKHITIQWRHNHHRIDCLLNRLYRRRSKKTSKLRSTGPYEGNPPTCDRWIPSQKASNEENVSIWWRHHDVNPAGTHNINTTKQRTNRASCVVKTGQKSAKNCDVDKIKQRIKLYSTYCSRSYSITAVITAPYSRYIWLLCHFRPDEATLKNMSE